MAKKAKAKRAKRRITRHAKKKGYVCESCGLAVTVDNICGCVEAHDIMCCGAPMKPKK